MAKPMVTEWEKGLALRLATQSAMASELVPELEALLALASQSDWDWAKDLLLRLAKQLETATELAAVLASELAKAKRSEWATESEPQQLPS